MAATEFTYIPWTKAPERRALILASDYCDNNEFIGAFVAFTSARFYVDIFAPGKEPPQTFRTAVHVHESVAPLTHTEYRGYDIKTTVNITSALEKDYEAIFITGGHSPEQLRIFPRVIELLIKSLSTCPVVAAICHGPELLISAGVIMCEKNSYERIRVHTRCSCCIR